MLLMNRFMTINTVIISMSLIFTPGLIARFSKSDCRSRGHEFVPDPVPYFRGDWSINNFYCHTGERSGSVVECLTRDREVAGSSLTGVTALWSLSKTHLS